MALDQKNTRQIFAKLQQHLSKVSDQPLPESVHRFRTYSRRVEALLGDLIQKPSRNQQKLLKVLDRLRKKAGRLRDLDVQIALLGAFRIPQEPARKAQLLREMMEDRRRRQKKLSKAFNEKTLRLLRKRLKRAAKEIDLPASVDPVQAAIVLVSGVNSRNRPLTEKVLHQYRIAGKRARYVAELAGPDPRGEQVVATIKRMQDVIGDWHDWLKLTARAEDLFGGAGDSPLVAALSNVTRAKFRQASLALSEAKAALSAKPAIVEVGGARPPSRVLRVNPAA